MLFVGIALGRGWLVTAREHGTVVHDRDEWRAECRIKDAQLAEKDVQLGHLEEVGQTVKQFARGIQQEMER